MAPVGFVNTFVSPHNAFTPPERFLHSFSRSTSTSATDQEAEVNSYKSPDKSDLIRTQARINYRAEAPVRR
jgi:hypothetical protein